MGKFRLIILTLFAVSAFSAVVAASVLATESKWLSEGKAITTAKPGLLDGLWRGVHNGGLAGNAIIHCNGQLHGTFGPGSADTVTDELGLTGELNKVHCEFVTGPCAGALGIFRPLRLPYATRLRMVGSIVWDEVSEGSTKAGTPDEEIECPSLGTTVTCEGNYRAKFIENGTNGAIFEFEGTESLEGKCSDGGKSDEEGKLEALGFTVS